MLLHVEGNFVLCEYSAVVKLFCETVLLGGEIQQDAVVHGVRSGVCTIWKCSGARDGRHGCHIQAVEGHVEILPVSSVALCIL